MPPSTSQRVGRMIALAVAYLASAKIGLSLDPVGGFATLVWAPTGIALAALSQWGRDLWPAVAVGAFAANVWTGAPPYIALGISLGNTLEAVVGVALLERLVQNVAPIAHLRSAFALIAVALLSSLISASTGASSLMLSGIVGPDEVGHTWLAWWLGDVLGDLVVAPCLLSWMVKPAVDHPRAHAESAALAVITVGMAFLSFSSGDEDPLRAPYVMFVPLIWAAVRYGPRASTSSMLLVSAIAIAFTVRGVGPFAMPSLSMGLIMLQAFMGFVAATTLVLAAVSEERAVAVSDAQRALEARDEFLAIASHELKTPISALSLMISNLKRTSDRPSAEGGPGASSHGDRLERARVQIERLDHLVDELLDVSRLTAGQLELTPEPFDLSELAHELAARMREHAARVGCKLAVLASQPVTGTWDRLRIEQVVINLLSNAFKYGPGQPVDLTVEAEGDVALLSVRDYGVGIGPEDVPRIFERYERATHEKRYSGLGLGLYIARQVVDAHGGTIRVQTTRGAGSTFTVELPLPPRRVRRITPEAPAPKT